MSFFMALFFGIYYWITMYDSTIWSFIGQPMMLGIVAGLFYGNVPLGLKVGAQIELIYIVAVAVGANMPADKVLGAFVAIPIVLSQHLTYELGLAIAVPFATLGPALDNIRRLINVAWNRKAFMDIDKSNWKGLWLDAYIYPGLVQLPIRVIPLAALLFLGSGSASAIINWLPKWVVQALSVLGGMLPAMGMVACMRMIGRESLLPYTLLGFFAMQVFKLPMLLFAVFAGVIAYLSVMNMKAEKLDFGGGAGKGADSGSLQYTLTKKELRSTCFRGMMSHRISQCMETFYGTGFCMAAWPCLKKLYGHDEEKFKDALRRHLVPYITEVQWGACIQGAAMAMEEELANGADIDPQAITAMRTGLMGPFAGLGDTIDGFILRPIVASVCIAMAMGGNPLGAIVSAWAWFITYAFGFPSFFAGYRLGKASLLNILKGGWIDKLMTGFGVLGMLMMGALSANYVKLACVAKFTISGKEFIVQSFFDQIVPGFLPFVLLVLSYLYMKRPKANYSKLMVGMLVVALIGAFLKIF